MHPKIKITYLVSDSMTVNEVSDIDISGACKMNEAYLLRKRSCLYMSRESSLIKARTNVRT